MLFYISPSQNLGANRLALEVDCGQAAPLQMSPQHATGHVAMDTHVPV